MEIVAPGSWVLVTGASSGIGEALARALAARPHPVLLAARSRERLESLAAELSAAHGVDVRAVPCDLSDPEGPRHLFEVTEGAGLAVDLLVNNAGFGLSGAAADLPLDRTMEMLRVNVSALTELTQRFLPAMRARRHGRILNVASTIGFVPAPYFASYAATKAYVLSYTTALREEVEADGVVVACLCPGYTRTRFFGVAGMRPPGGMMMLSPEEVADAALAGLERGTAVVVPNPLDRIWIASTRLLPRSALIRLMRTVFARSRAPKVGG